MLSEELYNFNYFVHSNEKVESHFRISSGACLLCWDNVRICGINKVYIETISVPERKKNIRAQLFKASLA